MLIVVKLFRVGLMAFLLSIGAVHAAYPADITRQKLGHLLRIGEEVGDSPRSHELTEALDIASRSYAYKDISAADAARQLGSAVNRWLSIMPSHTAVDPVSRGKEATEDLIALIRDAVERTHQGTAWRANFVKHFNETLTVPIGPRTTLVMFTTIGGLRTPLREFHADLILQSKLESLLNAADATTAELSSRDLVESLRVISKRRRPLPGDASKLALDVFTWGIHLKIPATDPRLRKVYEEETAQALSRVIFETIAVADWSVGEQRAFLRTFTRDLRLLQFTLPIASFVAKRFAVFREARTLANSSEPKAHRSFNRRLRAQVRRHCAARLEGDSKLL